MSPFKLFTHYRRFGIKLEEIAEQVKEIQPELIGISINFTPYWETAIEVAQICKLLLPQVPIVAGGHHATAAPERLLDSKAIDFVILGEGEERMVEFVKLLSTQNLGQLNDLDGIAFVSCGQIKINQQKYAIENLDNLSQPNQDRKSVV